MCMCRKTIGWVNHLMTTDLLSPPPQIERKRLNTLASIKIISFNLMILSVHFYEIVFILL